MTSYVLRKYLSFFSKIRTGDMMKWGECGAGSFMVYDLAGNYILGFLFHHCLGQIYGRKMLHLKAT